MPEKIPPYNDPNESKSTQILASAMMGQLENYANCPEKFNQYAKERLEKNMKITDEVQKENILRHLERLREDYLKSPEYQKIVSRKEILRDARRFEYRDRMSNPEKE